MSLEFAEKVRWVRESLGLTRKEFSDLLSVSLGNVDKWETLGLEETACWNRIIQFLIDCRGSAVKFLREKPWSSEGEDWSDKITDLLKTLGWSGRRLAEFLDVHDGSVERWSKGGPVSGCYKTVISLLEAYSEIDPKDWPAAIYSEPPDVITQERARLLRLSFGMKQSQMATLLHMGQSSVSFFERGDGKPRWCSNLLLRVLETYPRAVELLERIPWDDEIITPERVAKIRKALGFTGLELARLVGASSEALDGYAWEGISGPKQGCAILVYRLLEQYPEEFVSYLQGLSSPGGQACPIW